jgi:hypothetical protein
MFTLEHAIILILTVALIYYIVKHRNLLTDLFRIPERGHPELKVVKEKHGIVIDCRMDGLAKSQGAVSDQPINKSQKLKVTFYPVGDDPPVQYNLPYKRTGRNAAHPKNVCSQILFYNLDNVFYQNPRYDDATTEKMALHALHEGCNAFCARNDWYERGNICTIGNIKRSGVENKIYQATCKKGADCPYIKHNC